MDRRFIHPLRRIAEVCGISQRTTYRWIRFHGLPVFHTPSGKVATSVGLLEQWARERMEEERQRPSNGAWKRQRHKATGKWKVRLGRITPEEV